MDGDYVAARLQAFVVLIQGRRAAGATLVTAAEMEMYTRECGLDLVEAVVNEAVLESTDAVLGARKLSLRITRGVHAGLLSVMTFYRQRNDLALGADALRAAYSTFGAHVRAYLGRMRDAICATPPDETRIMAFVQRWTAHRLMLEWLVRIFTEADPAMPQHRDRFRQLGMSS